MYVSCWVGVKEEDLRKDGGRTEGQSKMEADDPLW